MELHALYVPCGSLTHHMSAGAFACGTVFPACAAFLACTVSFKPGENTWQACLRTFATHYNACHAMALHTHQLPWDAYVFVNRLESISVCHSGTRTEGR